MRPTTMALTFCLAMFALNMVTFALMHNPINVIAGIGCLGIGLVGKVMP